MMIKREEGEHEKEGAKVRAEKRGVRIGIIIIMAGEARGTEGKVKEEGETKTEKKREEKYG